ncbi:MAG: hypothetical protein DCC55_12860 [Chloroflexi bacterium]|nr:MAG: hypothetical protein DCC55_12860 [Chloroflexota bacterium]
MDTKSRLSRRQFLQFATVAVAGVTLAACAPATGTGEQSGQSSPGQASTTVRFMTNDVGWREERYRSILPQFKEAFPNIEVEYTHVTSDWEQSLTTWAAGGTLPGVFYSRTQKTASRARLNWIKPLTPYLDADPERDALLDDFWPIQVPQLQYKNDWYIIPENISSITLKFRPEAFEEAGVPYPDAPWGYYDEFPDVIRQLTKKEGDQVTRWGFDPAWMLTASGFAWLWLPAGIVDTENNRCIIDHPENAQALNMLQDLKFKERVIPRTEDLPEGVDLFTSSQLAMTVAGVWEITAVRDRLGEGNSWDVVSLPDNPAEEGQNLSINYGAGYALGRDAADPDAAWNLIRFLSRPEMQQVFIVEDNWALPGRKSVVNAWLEHVLNSGSGEPEHAAKWIDALERGRSVPVTPAEKEMEDQYPNLIGPILVTGEARAEEMLPQIQQEIQAILDKYLD